MSPISSFVQNVFGPQLSQNYALFFMLFVAVCLAFVIWAIYYAVFKGAVAELPKISWLSLRDTLKYTAITIATIIVVSSVLFVYDYGLDKVVNLIVKNAS